MAKSLLEAKPVSRGAQAVRRERTEALITARTQELFDRLPPLLGFSFDHELAHVEVDLERWPGYAWSPEVYHEVEALISELATDLAAEDPQGAEFLRGRTFARNLH